jgi:hypothetical protein
MIDFPLSYWNSLANHFIIISSLLAGFSITVMANFIVSQYDDRISKMILKAATTAASLFLITVFSMTKIIFMTTEGYHIDITGQDIIVPRILGTISFFLGTIALMLMIALSGWTKSKKMGWFTSSIALTTLIMILVLTVEVSL